MRIVVPQNRLTFFTKAVYFMKAEVGIVNGLRGKKTV